MMKAVLDKLSAISMILSLSMLVSGTVIAGPRIAVLNVDLNDFAYLSNTPEELSRTASIKPLLEQALKDVGDYEIIFINAQSEAIENAGAGYFFRFNDVAAKLAQRFGADWVVVGQHNKSSFLYSDLIVHLINVKTNLLSAIYNIELKGNNETVTKRAVRKLATNIFATTQSHKL